MLTACITGQYQSEVDWENKWKWKGISQTILLSKYRLK